MKRSGILRDEKAATLMQIDHLKIFCDLAEAQSFSKAATLHRISQSAVSQQVRALEKKLGVILVERGRRSFALTPEGQSLVDAAKEILAIYDDPARDYSRCETW